MRKVMDNSRLQKLGWKAQITLIISKFATKPFGKKISPIWFLSTFLILLNIYTISLQNIYRYNQHFAYQTNLIWFFLGWEVIVNYLVNGKIPPKKDLIRNCFLAFMLGVTAHFNSLSSIGGIFFLIFYGFVYWYIEEAGKIKKVFFKFYQLGKNVYIPLVLFLIGNILYFSAPSFQSLLEQRSPSSEGNRFVQALLLLPEFIPIWFETMFLQDIAWLFSLGIGVAIMFIIMSIWKYKYKFNKDNVTIQIDFVRDNFDKKIRIIISALALIIGVSFFMGTLVYSGKSYYNTDQFWLVHGDLKVLTRMMFLASLWVLVGYISTFNNKINRDLSIGIFLYSILSIFLFSNHYKTLYQQLKEDRKFWYQTEKIYRLYSLKEKKAILPAEKDEIREDTYNHRQLNWEYPENGGIGWTGNAYVLWNYPTIYYNDFGGRKEQNKKYYVSYILTNSNIALQLFEEEGGVFSEEELKETKFGRLFDPDFVTNAQKSLFNN